MKNDGKENFFSGIDQVDLYLGEEIIKFPVFYRRARAYVATFPASIIALKRLLPDPRFTPAQVFPGIGVISLAAFEYYDTDIGPYNEFGISVALNNPNMLKIPGYNLLGQLLQYNFYAYIHHLPVTTEIALRGGVDFYNYPKFLASIDFIDTAGQVKCELKEKDDLICRFYGNKIPATKNTLMKFFCHLYQYKQPQYVEFKINALEYGLSFNSGDVELEIGTSHPVALELANTVLSKRAMMYIYIPRMEAILYGPEHLTAPLLKFVLEEGMKLPQNISK